MADGGPHHAPPPLDAQPAKPALKHGGAHGDGRRMKWDEQNLHINEGIKAEFVGTIPDEPDTPYHHGAPMPDSDDEHEHGQAHATGRPSDHVAPTLVDQGSGRMAVSPQRERRSSVGEQQGEGNMQAFNHGDLLSALGGEAGAPTTPKRDGVQAQEEHEEEFKQKRKQHYNEFEMVRQMRERMARGELDDEDEDEDEEEE